MDEKNQVEKQVVKEMFDEIRKMETRNVRSNEYSDKQMVDWICTKIMKKARKDMEGTVWDLERLNYIILWDIREIMN